MLNYTWEAENRLTSTAGVTYTYDGDGRLVKKSDGTLYWYGLGGEVLEETDLSGNLLNDYIYFNGQRIARRDAAGGNYTYLSDRLGSSLLVLGPGGTKQELDYYPFGGERVITSTLENHYKFTGLERDTESGLDHTLYRKYTSNLGRWLSPDPVMGDVGNPQSLNRYGYVLNNPTNLTDPLGLAAGDQMSCRYSNGVLRCSPAPARPGPDKYAMREALWNWNNTVRERKPHLITLLQWRDQRGELEPDSTRSRIEKIKSWVCSPIPAGKADSGPCGTRGPAPKAPDTQEDFKGIETLATGTNALITPVQNLAVSGGLVGTGVVLVGGAAALAPPVCMAGGPAGCIAYLGGALPTAFAGGLLIGIGYDWTMQVTVPSFVNLYENFTRD